MFRALLAQRLRSCGPAFGFLRAFSGPTCSTLLYARLRSSSDIVIQSMPAVGHSFSPAVGAAMLAAVAAMKARRPSTVISTSLVYWSSTSAKPRCATTSLTEHPNASPLSELCKLFPILQGQLAGFTLFALAWDMPLLRPDSAEGLERRMTIALRNGRGRLPRDGHVRVGSSGKISLRAYRVRFIPANRSGSRHSGSTAQWHKRTHAPRQSCTVRQCRQPASRCLLLS